MVGSRIWNLAVRGTQYRDQLLYTRLPSIDIHDLIVVDRETPSINAWVS